MLRRRQQADDRERPSFWNGSGYQDVVNSPQALLAQFLSRPPRLLAMQSIT